MRSMTCWALSLSVLAFLSGCEEQRVLPRGAGGKASNAPAQPKTEIIKTREILGKTTQDVRDVKAEVQKGAQNAPMQVTAKDPITLGGNVYVVAVDQIAAMNVQHALDLYNAEHGEYPKNYQEFMDEIIKPGKGDGIALPRLPYYQEYGYDEKQHKLIVLEYPAKKAAYQEQQDKALGRK